MTRTIFSAAALLALLATGGAIGWGLAERVPAPERQVVFDLCPNGGGENCVVDGDTVWLDGVKIRLADIDTPETREPKCRAERALGGRATARLHALVNASPFSVQSSGDRDEDRYGRKLRVFVREGRSLGDVLVAEGLARKWTGRREPWC